MMNQFWAAGAAATSSNLAGLAAAETEPNLSQLAVLLGLFLIISVCLTALLSVLTALFPNISARSQTALRRSPWRAFFIGLANYLFLGGISLAGFNAGRDIFGLIGLILVIFLAVVTAFGLGGLAALTGERLAGLQAAEPSRLKQLIQGAVALELAAALPFFGWFVITPVIVMVAFGSAVLAWRNRKAVESLDGY